MRKRPRQIPLLLGASFSIAVHITVLVPAFVAIMQPSTKPHFVMARFHPDQFRHRPELPTDPDETPLGLDAPSTSKFTWVGYDEYQEHIASLAEIDQAAFNPDPAPPSTPTPQRDAATANENEAAEAVPPQEMPVEEPPAERPPEEFDESNPDPIEPDLNDDSERPADPTRATLANSVSEWLDIINIASEDMLPDEAIDAPAIDDPMTGEQPSELQPREAEPKPETVESPTPPTRPSETTPDEQPSQPTPPIEPRVGDRSDRESDATSVIEAEPKHWKAGRPLAAQGLEIKPRRPSFTALQTLTMGGNDPLCEIRFGRDGKPANARIIESSGNRQVDQSVLSSLYRWRASGQQLARLADGQSVPIRIRIVLRARR